MRPPARKLLVIATIAGAWLVPLAFAGVARLVRSQREAELGRERDLVAGFTQRVGEAEWRQTLPEAPSQPQWHLTDGAEVAATLQTLQTLVDRSGVTLISAKASPAVNKGRQQFLLSGRGRPEQVCALVASIERCERLIVVESGRVTPGNEEQVDFEFGLVTYHRGGER